MVEITSILAATQSLNAAIEVVRRFRDMGSDRAATELYGEMMSEILAAKEHAMSARVEHEEMANRLRERDQELREIKDFRRELESYELRNIGTSGFVFAPRPSEKGGEPPHWLCVACCHNDRKSILQFRRRGISRMERGTDVWACSACDAEILVPNHEVPVAGSTT